MSTTSPHGELDARFSSEGAGALPWSEVKTALERAEIFWLSTVRRDGRPHVTPLPAMWLDDALHFCTGPEEQKARNLAANPECVLTTGCNAFRSGLDIVVEGHASRVRDESLLQRLAAMWEAKLAWPFEVVEGALRQRPSTIAGDEPDPADIAYVFGVAPTKGLAFGRGEHYRQTRYRF